MKTLRILFILLLPFQWLSAQNLQPYLIGIESTEGISTLKKTIKKNLETNSIKVVGEYQPANDNNRWILVFTSPELLNSVKLVGGKTGFAATLRVALTVENGKTIVSYTNPTYWGNAYFQDNFEKVKGNYAKLSSNLVSSMKASGTYVGTGFGSKKGVSADDLQDYHYMMGMPYFEDSVELKDFESYSAAVSKIDANVKKGVTDVKMIYKVTIPGKNLTLYGFALSGENGESQFLPIIDISSPKHTAFLPYEVLVNDDEAYMLHGRYRIAIAFPDLTMGTFSKIMSTPGNIEDLLEGVVE